jgi:peptidoglycan/xylan/chitin deacetylase (PgdA/CDA1 family)
MCCASLFHDSTFLDWNVLRRNAVTTPCDAAWNQSILRIRCQSIARAPPTFSPPALLYPIDLYACKGWTASHFIDNVRPGAILVLHDGGAGRQRTVHTLAEILRRVHAMGYRLVTLSELVALRDEPMPESDQRQSASP